MAGIGPADQGLPPQIADSFRQKAKGRGLEDPEIDAITTYVLEHFAQWAQCDEDVVVKKGQGSGLARTIEYLHQSKTVVLHFKRKGGGALGEGRFSIVKPSIVVCSQTLPSGADLADKVAKDKTRAGQEREAYVSSQLVDAKHVRKVIRCSERGLLLEGMAQDLATRLKDWKSMTEIDRMGIAYHIIKGLRELHGADFSHQDLHAGNCFQSESGVWKIGDLGCAQRLGEIQTAELNLAVASPAAISARVFGFSHICSIEDDLWALALLLYRLRYGRAPEFSTSQAIQGMMDALAERDACYEAMRSLTDEQRKILFTCRLRSEEEIPPELREHAERLKSVWQSMRSHYKKYSEDLHVFHDSFAGWSEELGQLITQLFASENLNEGWLEKAESRLAPYMRTYSRDNPVQQAIASTDEAPVLEFQAYGMGTEQAYSEDTVPFTNEDEEWRLVNPAMEQVKGAIQSEDCRALLDYIERGCNIVDWIDPVGNGILHQVALLHRGSGRRVSELLGFLCRCGADVNDRNPEGKTAAHLFAEAGDIDALYDLWILGADFGLIDQAGHKAEYYAEKAGVRFVDETKLLAVRSADFKWSHESYTNWYLNQAPILELLEARSDIDTELRQRLERTVLMSYFKVARQIVYSQPIATVQRNPLPAGSYHRNSSPWIMKVIEILRTSRGDLIQPISSPLFLDVMKRYFGPERYFEINGLAKLRDTFSALKQKYEAGAPTKYCYLDCSELKKDTPEYLLIDSIELCARKFLNEEFRPFLFLFGFSKEHDLYYLRAISMGSPEGLRILNGLATYSGHVPPPEDAMRFAQEQPGGLKSILQEVGLPVAKLVTAGHGVPVIFPSFSDLLELNSFRQLKVLAETLGDLAPPYVQALASATADVLKALQDLPVDRSYSDEGIGDLLQISCLKIHNAMGMACGRWNNFDAFLNEISLIHHEIQNILYMASLRHGYEPGSYERDFIERITSGADPLVPEGLGDLTVSLQPSDMHCFHSILSAMEIQAGTPALCMCIGEKCYFEAVETVQGG
ncbi:MAG: protein kinase family protein, partial [Chlamydiia bacterium]|nr:protein kinase family protein [Chlamydiia bacterium]